MALFRFGHAQKNALASVIPLAIGEVAIGLRGLDFGLPVTLGDFDRLLSILPVTRRSFAAHKLQSAGSNAVLIDGSSLARSCCAEITSATEPIIRPAAMTVRRVTVSPAKRVPNRTATIG